MAIPPAPGFLGEPATISTPRLVLRRFRPDDGAGLQAYLSLPEAVRFEPYGVQSLAQCEQEAERRVRDPAFWAVCLPDSGALIGHLFFAGPDHWLSYELGYVFHPGHWGNGYASEAAKALVDTAFTKWGGHRVRARCNPENTASWRLLERCGFRREGHLRGNASFAEDADGNPVWQDTYLYAVLAGEWATGSDG